MKNISYKAKELLNAQIKEWSLAGKNYSDLNKVITKTYKLDGFELKVQFNPGRIVSSSAKVDKKSIQQRPCFLCAQNRPEVQDEIKFNNYLILINPFPIFPEHFTIPKTDHTLQLIEGNFEDMLDLSEAMSDYTFFYNGPNCGASAPDHFHFQAGIKGFMPIDNETESLKKKYGKKLANTEVELWAVQDGFRNFYIIESIDKDALTKVFETIYRAVEKVSPADPEPALNIHANFTEGLWKVLIFPRGSHRPSQYFAEGDDNILISPASVDFGGVLITPREKDFEKINITDIKSIMQQVSYPQDKFNEQLTMINEQ